MAEIVVNLPSSGEPPYHKSYWSQLEADLKSLLEEDDETALTFEKLEQIILGFVNQKKYCTESSEKADTSIPNRITHKKLQNLERVMKEKDKTRKMALIAVMCKFALEMPHLFPEGSLVVLRRDASAVLTLNRNQIGCLVAHMFFCTFLPSLHLDHEGIVGHLTAYSAPTGPITFANWHWCSFSSNSTTAYLNTLFNYFEDIGKSTGEDLNQSFIEFKRVSNAGKSDLHWEKSETKLTALNLNLEGRIGDLEGECEMDFANEHVGFGTTGTQEELILGMSPETCPIVLFNEILGKKDALLITGAKRYGIYSGYGRGTCYLGPCTDNLNWAKRRILAMDAKPWIGSPLDQLKGSVMKRELEKALAAFSSVADKDTVIGTGHWGCGAFGGNMGIKALLQLMAASEAGVTSLEFYCFGDEEFESSMRACLNRLGETDATVSDVWEWLRKYERVLAPSRLELATSAREHYGVLDFIAEGAN